MYIWQFFGCFISVEAENQMFADVSLRSQKVRCVGVVILAMAFNGFGSVLVALVLPYLLQRNLRAGVGLGKMVLTYD